MEADLLRFYQIDLRDHWRKVEGRVVLTLRRIKVLLAHLPEDSALAVLSNDGKPVPTVEAVLLADIWQQLAAQSAKQGATIHPHPLMKAMTAESEKRHNEARRAALDRANAANIERRRAIAAGEIT